MSVAEPQSSTNPQLRPGHQQESIAGSFTGQPAHRPQQAPAAPAPRQAQPAGGQHQPSQQAVLSGQHQSVQGLLTGPRATPPAGGPAGNPHSPPQLVGVPVHQAQQAGRPTPPPTVTPAGASKVQAVGPTHHQGMLPAGVEVPQAIVGNTSTQQQQQQQVPASGAAVASGAPDCASLAALSLQQQQQQHIGSDDEFNAFGNAAAQEGLGQQQQQQQPAVTEQQKQQHIGSDDDFNVFAAAPPPNAAAQAGQQHQQPAVAEQQQQQPPAVVAGQGFVDFPDATSRVLLGAYARDGSYLTTSAAAAALHAHSDALVRHIRAVEQAAAAAAAAAVEAALAPAGGDSSDDDNYMSELGAACPQGAYVHIPAVQQAVQEAVQQAVQQATAALQQNAAILRNAAAHAETLWTPINTCDRSDFTVLDFTGGLSAGSGGGLGAGSFGTVQQGCWKGTPVAVKFLKTNIKRLGVYSEAERLSALMREAQLQARAAGHKHIAALNAVWCAPPSASSDEPYGALIMEECQCSLEARILNCWDRAADRVPQPHAQWVQQQHPEPSWPLTIKLLKHASAALGHLHTPGRAIFHNDCRAANLLLKLVVEGGKVAWELKLCDFGLACEAGTQEAVEVETVTNSAWLAPEVHSMLEDGRVVRRVTAATDIFSLGCVMHEMALREGPTCAPPSGELHEDLLKPRLGDQTPGIPDPFRKLVRDCVSADARQRPRADDLHDQIFGIYTNF